MPDPRANGGEDDDHGNDPAPFSALLRATAGLDEADQELFHLKWFLGMTDAQLADLLGCSEKAVKQRWNRVKEFLRRRGFFDLGITEKGDFCRGKKHVAGVRSAFVPR